MRRGTLRLSLLLAFPIVAAGCGEPPLDESSAGPRLVLIEESAPLPPTFTTDIAALTDSTACVIDSFQVQVLCGDRGWRQVRTFGRKGSGPGEFQTPASVTRADSGRVAVADATLSRLTVFSPEGEVIHSITQSDLAVPLVLMRGEFVGFKYSPPGSGRATAVQRISLHNGSVAHLHLGAPPPLQNGDPGAYRAGVQALDGEWVFWTGDYRLVRYSSEGVSSGDLVGPSFPPELASALDAEIMDEYVRGYLGVSAGADRLRRFRAMPKAALIRDRPLRADAGGRVWAATTRDQTHRSFIDVFDRTGWVGTAELPDRLLGFDIHGSVLAALVLVPASHPDDVHDYRVRWYRIVD